MKPTDSSSGVVCALPTTNEPCSSTMNVSVIVPPASIARTRGTRAPLSDIRSPCLAMVLDVRIFACRARPRNPLSLPIAVRRKPHPADPRASGFVPARLRRRGSRVHRPGDVGSIRDASALRDRRDRLCCSSRQPLQRLRRSPLRRTNPFRCKVQKLGTGTEFKNPNADPLVRRIRQDEPERDGLRNRRLPAQRAGEDGAARCPSASTTRSTTGPARSFRAASRPSGIGTARTSSTRRRAWAACTSRTSRSAGCRPTPACCRVSRPNSRRTSGPAKVASTRRSEPELRNAPRRWTRPQRRGRSTAAAGP